MITGPRDLRPSPRIAVPISENLGSEKLGTILEVEAVMIAQ